MGDFADSVGRFYQLVDRTYLEATGKPLSFLEDRLTAIMQDFKNEFDRNCFFEGEAKREVICRLLLFSIENDLGVESCLVFWNQLQQFDFDDITYKWLILCQVSRYFRTHNSEIDILSMLNEFRSALAIELEGIQESLTQVLAEIESWKKR